MEKTFIGYVNGQEFDNETDFKIAASKALLMGDDQICISSYYKDSTVKENNNTTEQPYISISDITPKDESYTLPEDKIQLFNKISENNLKEIANHINEKVTSYEKHYCNLKTKNQNLLAECERVKKQISNVEEAMRDVYNSWNYYKTLQKSLPDGVKFDVENKSCNCGCNCEDECDEHCDCKNENKCNCDNESTTSKKNVDYICELLKDFPKYLNDIGFWGNNKY